jgi:D-sedoheptulose 7-phosphate isomerase
MSRPSTRDRPAPTGASLAAVVEARFALSAAVTERFFEQHAGHVSEACLALADRFRRGGRLLAFGTGAEASDAHHVAVEFVHPVLVGKRALPALALTADAAALTGAARDDPDDGFVRLVQALGRPEDIALGISRGTPGPAVARGLAAARAAGLLTVAVMGWEPEAATTRGGDGGVPAAPDADLAFVVPSGDPLVVQEVQETLYHVFWELVHVFLDREAP